MAFERVRQIFKCKSHFVKVSECIHFKWTFWWSKFEIQQLYYSTEFLLHIVISLKLNEYLIFITYDSTLSAKVNSLIICNKKSQIYFNLKTCLKKERRLDVGGQYLSLTSENVKPYLVFQPTLLQSLHFTK